MILSEPSYAQMDIDFWTNLVNTLAAVERQSYSMIL